MLLNTVSAPFYCIYIPTVPKKLYFMWVEHLPQLKRTTVRLKKKLLRLCLALKEIIECFMVEDLFSQQTTNHCLQFLDLRRAYRCAQHTVSNDFKIEHIQSTQFGHADVLSRLIADQEPTINETSIVA